jgi:hypothetical protein
MRTSATTPEMARDSAGNRPLKKQAGGHYSVARHGVPRPRDRAASSLAFFPVETAIIAGHICATISKHSKLMPEMYSAPVF